ncbi:MAG: hypothetical protein K6E19_10780 [Lachnospiraceae bacterium]|nr:hypothetical protein [Lachnospiraceae bacterium]
MRAENDETRSRVLENLYNEMKITGLAANLVKKGESGNDFDILICRHDELGGDEPVIGQYFFPDYGSAENVMFFSTILTIKEDVDAKEAKQLAPTIASINEQTACGHFVHYPDIGLVYKLTVPISENMDEDDLYEAINIVAANAISVCASFKGLFA